MGVILESRSTDGIYYLANMSLQRKMYRCKPYYWSNNIDDPCVIFTSKARALNSFNNLCKYIEEYKTDEIRVLNSETHEEV